MLLTIDGATTNLIFLFWELFLIIIIMTVMLNIIAKFFRAIFFSGDKSKNENEKKY